MCARLCRHLLAQDDGPAVSFIEGQPMFPQLLPVRRGEKVMQQRRILIYQEFPRHAQLLESMGLLTIFYLV